MCSKYVLLKSKQDTYKWPQLFGTALFSSKLAYVLIRSFYFNKDEFLSRVSHQWVNALCQCTLSGCCVHGVVNITQVLISLRSERVLCNIILIRCNMLMARLPSLKAFMLLSSYVQVLLMCVRRAKLWPRNNYCMCLFVCVNECT